MFVFDRRKDLVPEKDVVGFLEEFHLYLHDLLTVWCSLQLEVVTEVLGWVIVVADLAAASASSFIVSPTWLGTQLKTILRSSLCVSARMSLEMAHHWMMFLLVSDAIADLLSEWITILPGGGSTMSFRARRMAASSACLFEGSQRQGNIFN